MSFVYWSSLLSSVGLALATSTAGYAPADSVLHATDLQGHVVDQLAPANAKAVVLVFAATDCPISNRYVPEISRLEQEFSKQDVAVWWVFPNPDDTAAVVHGHAIQYSIHNGVLLDVRQELVKMAHVSLTPEAAVFTVDSGQLREVYHGRIDDRYRSFSQSKQAATHHDLEDAIKAVLAGQPVAAASGGPVGCSIVPLNAQP